MSNLKEDIAISRRRLMRSGLFWGFTFVIAPGIVFSGCGDKSRNSGGNNPPPGGGTTTVMAALTSRYGQPQTRSTTHGNKITSVGNVSGENIVYTVNGARDDNTRPENRTVNPGDTIDVFDLVNGSRLAFTVS